ncbi:hypothetical protein [Leptobacterium sp. I13]|uniref:hypothetical protein n=1 Tax=Leptobacterium meishanense TaxID=3128904 RepID=UPI0030ED7ADB
MKIITTYLTLAFLVLTSCNQKTGGKCEYVNLEALYRVFKTEMANNTLSSVTFQMVEGNEQISLPASELNTISGNFEIDMLNASESTFLINYDEITKGSCVPIIIQKITIKED